jgi:hypothetical protein
MPLGSVDIWYWSFGGRTAASSVDNSITTTATTTAAPAAIAERRCGRREGAEPIG